MGKAVALVDELHQIPKGCLEEMSVPANVLNGRVGLIRDASCKLTQVRRALRLSASPFFGLKDAASSQQTQLQFIGAMGFVR